MSRKTTLALAGVVGFVFVFAFAQVPSISAQAQAPAVKPPASIAKPPAKK